MKKIDYRIVINDEGQIATALHVEGIDLNKVEGRLMLIGVLENIKRLESDKIKTFNNASFKKKDNGDGWEKNDGGEIK